MQANKLFFHIPRFLTVASPTGNPKAKGYYELRKTTHVKTEDTSVQAGKTYYTQDMEWVDAYDTYGVYFDDAALSTLMAPAPNKEVTENASDLQHGKRVTREVTDTRKDERTFSISMYLTAKSKAQFFQRYAAFCTDILDNGFFDIKTEYFKYSDNGVEKPFVFRVTYEDCKQFTEYNSTFAKFQLSLNEPDPTNRLETDRWENE